MGFKINNLYINFKTSKRTRIQKPIFETIQEEYELEGGTKEMRPVEHDTGEISDTTHFNVYLNVYSSIEKIAKQVVKATIELPYKPDFSDNDIYTELKKQVIKIKDGFGQDIELDLSKAEDLI